MTDFIADLDEYIAKNYDDYSVISSLSGFKMPALAGLKRVYALTDTTYNYKPDTAVYRIYYQLNRTALLAELKRGAKDFGEIFNFISVPWKTRALSFFNRNLRRGAYLSRVIKAYGFTPSALYLNLGLSKAAWEGILFSRLYPSKRLIFKICLLIGALWHDIDAILAQNRFVFDISSVPELVVKYLLERRVFNQSLIDAAFKEYNIEPL